MERDFLGAIGRIKEESEMKEKAGSKPESDYLGGGAPATQWQYQAKAAATPPFMSFRPAREDSFAGFRQQPAVVTAGARMPHHQSQFGFDGHVSPQQYSALAHAHDNDSYDVAARHLQGGSRPFHQPIMQFNPGNPMLRVQTLPSVAGGVQFKNPYLMMNNPVPSSTVGVYGPRNPEPTRMTIFYNGAVNVFDVPLDKAQEIMVLASRASIPSPTNAVQKSESLVTVDTRFAARKVSPARKVIIQKPETFVPHLSGISTPIPAVLQDVALSNESAGPSSLGVPSVVPPVSRASSAEPVQQAISAAAAVAPRAVPQARKASLARFLEKRKERVSTVMPYPSLKSPLDSSDSTPSKSSGTDIALSINNSQEPTSLGLSRNISFSSEKVPSTNLQI